MKIEIQRNETSFPIVYDKVVNAYTKGPMYCVLFEKDGKRFSHTIDARTGTPITHRLASVSVIDASAQRADGLSTLLMLLGPDQGYEFARQAGVAALFIRHTGQGFASRTSPAFDRLFPAGDRP